MDGSPDQPTLSALSAEDYWAQVQALRDQLAQLRPSSGSG